MSTVYDKIQVKSCEIIERYDEWYSRFPLLFNLDKSPVQFMEMGC